MHVGHYGYFRKYTRVGVKYMYLELYLSTHLSAPVYKNTLSNHSFLAQSPY